MSAVDRTPARRVGERVKCLHGARTFPGTVKWSDHIWVQVVPDRETPFFVTCKPEEVFSEVGDLALANRLRDIASGLVDEAIRIEDEHRSRGS